MRILVTGGAGFIGSHLVERLLHDGHTIDVVDTFVTGSRRNLPQIHDGRVKIKRIDVARAPYAKYDWIFHLASPASPVSYLKMQRLTLVTNALGTLRTLRIAARSGARYLLASTSEVYGDPTLHPQRETYWGNVNPVGVRSSYDEGKRFAEALVVAHLREIGVDARVVRIFNTYGPRMGIDDGRMPSAFITAALRGTALHVEGDGRQTRSLCYVRDTVSGLTAAMRRGRAGGIYNIGRPEEVSVLQFARLVIRLTGSTSAIAFVPERPEAISRRKPDISKAKRDLGWEPRTSLASGLPMTIAWFRKELE